MSKERLGEMNNKVTGLTDSDGDFVDAVKMKIDVYAWFYEQAERVQELRMFQKHTVSLAEVVSDLEQQNKRYRELIQETSKEIEVLTDVMSNADNADELNFEVIRLKGLLEGDSE